MNSTVQSSPIKAGGAADPSTLGQLISEYEVKEYWDLRGSNVSGAVTSSNDACRAYLVTARQKLFISNATPGQFATIANISGYADYPVLALQAIQPLDIPAGISCYVENYSPKTLNAAVTQTANLATNSSNANSVQRTSGSMSSVTNSYEVSANIGFFGDQETGGISGGAGFSSTYGSESSISKGTSDSSGVEAGKANSMSIKDWCSFAFLDSTKQQPSWIWAQEYPWNVIDFHSVADGNVQMPNFVAQRMWDGQTLFPPSYLAQFGIDFTAMAQWVFYMDGVQGDTDEIISFQHNITIWTGTHTAGDPTTIPPTPLSASLSVITGPQALHVDTVSLNLPICSLLPIIDLGRGNGAIIGFVRSEFISNPTGPTTPFRLKSSSNNVYVTGMGFDTLTTEDSVFSAAQIPAQGSIQYTLRFKIIDNSLELSLFIKHWNLSENRCMLSVAINEPDPENPVNPITRYVEANESATGSDNVSIVALRKKDYMAADFYDYLVMGLNTVVITVTGTDPQATCGYALRALSIG